MVTDDESSQAAGPALARTLSHIHLRNRQSSSTAQNDTYKYRSPRDEEVHIDAKLGEPKIDIPQFQFYSSESPYVAGFVIHPLSRIRIFWDVCVFFMLLICMLVYSYRFALLTTNSFEWFFCTRAANLFWLMDMIIQVNTAVREYDILITDRFVILNRYLKTWFIPDLFAVIPWDLEFANILVGNIVPLGRIFESIHIFRFYKIGKIIRGFTISLRLRHVTERVMKLVVIAIFIAHLNACIFTFIAVVENRLGQLSWISDQGIDPNDVYTLYATSLYWSMATVTTIGYGDVVSVSTVERVFNIFAVIVGAGGFAFIITSLVGYIGRVPKKDEQFNDKLDSVNAYIKFRRIPSALAERIRRFHILAFHGSIHELRHEREIIDELPQSLKHRLAIHVSRQLCDWSTFFIGADPNFNLDLLMAMEEKYLPAGETVVFKGEYCGEIYIIEEGCVESVFDGGRLSQKLNKGEYFGMDGLISETKVHLLTYRSMTWVKLRALKVEDLLEIVWKYPITRQTLFARANKLPNQDFTPSPRPAAESIETYPNKVSQIPIVTFLVQYRAQIEKRIISRYMFRPGHELGEPTGDQKVPEGTIDLAAVQESILKLDLSLCNELSDRLRKRLQLLDSQPNPPADPRH